MILAIPWRLSELPAAAVATGAQRCGPYRSPWQHHPERQCAAYRHVGGSDRHPTYRRCALLASEGREFCGKHQPMFERGPSE